MFERMVSLGLFVWLVLASTCVSVNSHAQDAQPCEAVRQYLLRVDQISIQTFGDDRYTKLSEAQKEFRDQLDKLKQPLSGDIDELIAKYVSLTTFGHDRMRKGDSRMLVRAREVQELIKQRCPW